MGERRRAAGRGAAPRDQKKKEEHRVAMIRELMKCIREFKRPSILSPVLVSLEVVMECLIPLVIANLVNEIKAGCVLDVIGR